VNLKKWKEIVGDLVLRWSELVYDEHVLSQFATQLPHVLQQTFHLPLMLLLYVRYLGM